MATRTATLPTGETVTVEIVDGKTQTDGLPSGTVVHTDGGNFTIGGGTGGNYTTGGGSGSSPSQVYAPGGNGPENLMEGGGNPSEYDSSWSYTPEPDPMEEYRRMQQELTEAQRRSRIAALDKSRTNALSTLDAEEAAIGPEYYNKRNQAAARSDVGAMNFAQYMAARGIKGAAGAMPEIYRNASLQGQIGALDQQEAQNKANIGRQRSSVNTAYEYDVAQANADLDSQSMQAMIDQYNADRQYRLQEAGLTGSLGGTPTLAKQQMETEYTGYYNPWASYELNEDISSQLAPYMGNLQAFIDENPNSPLAPYAQNARYQKIMSSPELKEKYGTNYMTAAGMRSTLQNRLAQLEIDAQEIMNSNLPETEKLKVERLRQEVATGRLDPVIAQAQLAQIKAQTANVGASTALGRERLAYDQQQDAEAASNKAFNDAVASIDSLYVYNDPVTGAPTVNKNGLRSYILSLNLPDNYTTSLLTRYGV